MSPPVCRPRHRHNGRLRDGRLRDGRLRDDRLRDDRLHGSVSAGLIALAVLLLTSCTGGSSGAAELAWTVEQDGLDIGAVEVFAVDGVDGGVEAVFVPASASLDGAAADLGADHLGWYQFIRADPDPLDDAGGELLTVPYVDPPCGGYGGVERGWADALPWYWDETAPPPGAIYEDPGNQLTANIDGEELLFSDSPSSFAGSTIGFTTYLVAVDESGDPMSFHGGWTWDATFDDETTTVTNVERTATDAPTEVDFEELLEGSSCPY